MLRLIVKLGALLAFTGGPLYMVDLLRVGWGQKPAFLLAFTPLALLIFGLLTIAEEDELGGFGRVVVLAGAAGAAGLVIQDIFALTELARGVVHPNTTMILLGSIVGIGVVATYGALAHGALVRRGPS